MLTVTDYYKELLNFCARTLKDRDAAADLVQEAYTRFLVAQRSGAAIADPRALLFRTMRNLLIDQHRRAEVRMHLSLDTLLEEEQPLAPRHLQPEEVLAFSRYAQALYAAIESLPRRCREAFILNRFDGLSHQEVAEKMGISRNMVAQHVIRGVLVCKACDDRFHDRVVLASKPAE
ncbi:MAG: putative RNA polymerase sigma factor FecI [Nitrosomonas europaea]|uniref:sigma-70 family RNA polymerase sigma factor n=1 Tax=Nitrosomonas TaxID=914 RepID=UPI0023F10496|nr:MULTISPECIES: sigma-70 family RNA polymerase sigma factor [Nitrosomonas]MBV6390048.1 putative RNA polymerase sigma factor FecI [Nitrosomonas europaea]